MNKTMKTTQLIAALLATAVVALPGLAHVQKDGKEKPAIENAADDSAPTLDQLLGLEDAAKPDNKPDNKPGDQPDKPEDKPVDPKLNRDLDRALTGEQATQQFEQAVQEMGEVAIRIGDEGKAGIDTQRMQDQIILKLDQVISTAKKIQQKQQQQQQKKKSGQQQQQQQQQAREADKGGKQQQGKKPGEKQGQKPGDKNGQQQGKKPGDKPGDKDGQQQGKKPGDKDGKQQGNNKDGKNGDDSSNAGGKGSLRNIDLSMKDLREGEWGNLPPRLRDELAESLGETFNPEYRSATEAFYRRIAEMSKELAEEKD